MALLLVVAIRRRTPEITGEEDSARDNARAGDDGYNASMSSNVETVLSQNDHEYATITPAQRQDRQESNNPNKKLRIAIISGFVANPDPMGPRNSQKAPRISPTLLDHMLNKVCYAKMQGYDFIFNSTAGFPDKQDNQYWLNYGTWHRVPHIMAALPKYDWILYTDTDYVFQDLTTPLEVFIKDWELHQLRNVSVFVPTDLPPNNLHVFSAFTIFIRNSPFGRRLLENWWEFSQGMCPKGNFASTPGRYTWCDSDQPGLWYAMTKTHSEFRATKTRVKPFQAQCNDITGVLTSQRCMGPETNAYFKRVRAIKGNEYPELDRVPKDQPIVWSKLTRTTRSGLGVQLTFGSWGNAKGVEDWSHAFGLHVKKQLTAKMKGDLQNCRRAFNCTADYTEDGVFRYGCSGKSSDLAADV